jgi:hypothetical protein
MKIIAMTMVAAALGSTAGAREAQPGPDRTVTVCMEAGMGDDIMPLARGIATRMFEGIGVTIHWRVGFTGCPVHAIRVSIRDHTPATLLPGALAYALPLEGVHIRVLYDRVVFVAPQNQLLTRVMAHVLAHEITHILEGVPRHSQTGVMKPHWDAADYGRMLHKPLPFAPEDIALIDAGLAARARAARPPVAIIASHVTVNP